MPSGKPVHSTEYQLDFDQVAEAGFRAKHRPTFPLANLDHATEPGLRSTAFVRTHERYHHGAWYLPLYDRRVRHWLRAVRFTQAPTVHVGGAEVGVGKEVLPP